MRRPRVARAGNTRGAGVGVRSPSNDEDASSMEASPSEDDMVERGGGGKRKTKTLCADFFVLRFPHYSLVSFFLARHAARAAVRSARARARATRAEGSDRTLMTALPTAPLAVLRGHAADVQALAFAGGEEGDAGVLVVG